MRFPGIYRALNNETNNGHNNDRRDEIIEIGKTPKGRRTHRTLFFPSNRICVLSRGKASPLIFLSSHLVFYATRSFPLCTCRVLCFLTKARKSRENKRKKRERETERVQKGLFHSLLGSYLYFSSLTHQHDGQIFELPNFRLENQSHNLDRCYSNPMIRTSHVIRIANWQNFTNAPRDDETRYYNTSLSSLED